MKANVYVEYADRQFSETDLVPRAKALWTKSGHKVSEITSLQLYVKPEEQTVYVVINETFTESFSL